MLVFRKLFVVYLFLYMYIVASTPIYISPFHLQHKNKDIMTKSVTRHGTFAYRARDREFASAKRQ